MIRAAPLYMSAAVMSSAASARNTGSHSTPSGGCARSEEQATQPSPARRVKMAADAPASPSRVSSRLSAPCGGSGESV